jgi:AAA domain/TrwC relaxase
VLLAIGDERVREAVLEAQAAGVAAGLAYLEAHELQARRGAQGARIIAAHGLVGAAYVHEMSRSGDPHLHTHAVVANAVRGADGRYSALDMRPIFGAAKTAGTIAEAVMRHELTRALGVAWGPVRNGTAELAGISPTVLAHFSARHAEIEELVTARGSRGLAAVGAAQRQTRDRKPVIERELAQADWRARAAEQGLGRDEIAGLFDRVRPMLPNGTERAQITAALVGPTGLTERQSTFGRRDLLRALAEAHPGGAPADWLEALADDFLTDHARLIEPTRPGRGLRAVYTTPELLAVEARLLALADARDVWAPPAPEHIEQALSAHPHLGPDQRAAVRHLATGDGRLRLLEAHAGRGKTAALRAFADAHARAGTRVLGVAWQGEAAQTLAREAAIPTETAARVLHRLRRDPDALSARAVLVVDEAATMPTRALAELAERVAAHEGRLVLVGDRAQLPAIEAGGAFACLADRLGTATLSENRRQRDPLQAEVADALAEGRPHQALAMLSAHGGLSAFAAPEDARAQLVEDWARAALCDPASCLILAHDRADVAALNALARAALDEAGALGPERLLASGREWAAGDRLVCRRNDYRPGLDVRNGTRGTVERVDPDAGTLTLRADDGRFIDLPADYLDHAHHGYAVTGHVSQEATVDRTFLLASPERGGAEWAYVAASRHRIDLRVYAIADEPERAAEALAATWERRQAKHLATERLQAAGRGERALEREVPDVPAPTALGTVPELARQPEGDRLRLDHARLLEELAGRGPPDPTPELRRLEAERGRLGADLARGEEERQRAESVRAAIGRFRMVGRAGQEEAARHDKTVAEAAARAQNLAAQLADTGRRRTELVANEAKRDLWHQERLPQVLARLEAIEHELARAGHGDEVISARPSPELAAASRTLTDALERSGPPGPRPQIARRQAQWERLDRLGLRLLGRSGREEGRQLRAAIARSEHAQERIYDEQTAAVRELSALRAALECRERWERELAAALSERADVLESEIARRVEARLPDIEREPPAYLTEALGPRPEQGRSPERWPEAALAIEGYRERHGIADPQRALGPEPENPVALVERRPIERTVEDVRAELSYLARTLERLDTARPEPGYDRGPRHGLERGLDHGPSLGMGL